MCRQPPCQSPQPTTMRCVLQLFVLCVAAAAVAGREVEPCVCFGEALDCSFRERNMILAGEVCRSARKANMRGNYLRTFPEGLRFIVEVDVSRNKLKHLPYSSMLNQDVKVLDVSTNEIAETSEELATFSALEVLSVRENRLTSLGFLPSPCALKRLDASLNALSTVDGPLRECEKLEALVLTNNDIVSLPEGLFTRMGKLEVLDIRNNRLMQVCSGLFDGVHKLRHLRLSKNQLTSLPAGVFSKLRELKDLDLAENPFAISSPNAMDGLKSLETLTMGVVREAALPSGLFASTGQLQKLTLDLNGLTTLPRDLFRPLRLLEKMDLLGSHLNDLPEGLLGSLGQLKTLNLFGSQLRHLPDGFFAGLHSLGVLDLRANRLTELPELNDCCERLWYADFSENNISIVSEAALRILMRSDITVHLRDNPLRATELRWAVLAADIQQFVEDGECGCGGLRHESATVDFCVDVPCDSSAQFQDWVSAVRASGRRNASNAQFERPEK